MNTLTKTKKQAESASARASWPAWLNSNTIALLIGMATIGLALAAMMQTSYSRLENSIGTLRQELRLEIREVRNELRREFRQEIGGLRDELRAFDGRLRSVETDVAAIKASLGLDIGAPSRPE